MDKARETALKSLMEIEKKDAYSNLVLKKNLKDTELDARDRAFVTELVYGTVTRKLTLDWIISQYSRTKLSKLSPWVLQILRMGIYQLLFLDRVPPSAACNTSVNLSKKFAKASSGFINAILRNISRKKEEIHPEAVHTGSITKDMSIQYSFPEYLVQDWLSVFGEKFLQKLLASLLERPDFSVRVNTLKTNREEVLNALAEAGIQVMPGRFLNEALVLQGVTDISRSPLFIDGKITVQDESSMLVAKILDPKPGEQILDVCAAPGGKTTHIAQCMNNDGRILAWDIHEHKTGLIRENAKRLGIGIIETERNDALIPMEKAKGCFHRVLVDAPCSGTGIVRRKPDIKWQRKQEDIVNLIEIQRGILYNSSRYVVPGGVLVYSTCSLDSRENEQIVHDFLNENPEFETTSLASVVPGALKDKGEIQKGMLHLYPHMDETDGFFIARLKRKEETK